MPTDAVIRLVLEGYIGSVLSEDYPIEVTVDGA